MYSETVKENCINCGNGYNKEYWRKTKNICQTCKDIIHKFAGDRWIKNNYLINKGGN